MKMVGTRKEIYRCGEKIVFEDKELDGYRIEFPYTECENEWGATFIKFKSFDDYLKFYNIDNWLHFLYCGNSYTNSCLIKEDENLFYNNLKEIEKIIKDCKNMKIVTNESTALYKLFRFIDRFLEESIDGFKHENKILEKKFHKVAIKLEKLCEE